MKDSAVIFDVDGVLLDLTAPEEDAFFLAFERRYGITGLSRDWDNYRVRNTSSQRFWSGTELRSRKRLSSSAITWRSCPIASRMVRSAWRPSKALVNSSVH
jgi:FMN phosphatase YigB (HAD superfamily)